MKKKTSPEILREMLDIPSAHLKDADYILDDGAAWFTVGKFSVRIQKTDEGVLVDIYPVGKEADGSIASTYALDDEVS